MNRRAAAFMAGGFIIGATPVLIGLYVYSRDDEPVGKSHVESAYLQPVPIPPTRTVEPSPPVSVAPRPQPGQSDYQRRVREWEKFVDEWNDEVEDAVEDWEESLEEEPAPEPEDEVDPAWYVDDGDSQEEIDQYIAEHPEGGSE